MLDAGCALTAISKYLIHQQTLFSRRWFNPGGYGRLQQFFVLKYSLATGSVLSICLAGSIECVSKLFVGVPQTR